MWPSLSPFTVEKSDSFSRKEIKLFFDSDIALDELLSIYLINYSAFSLFYEVVTFFGLRLHVFG